jgi:hypothetical protein
MYYLAMLFPPIRKFRISLSRDQIMLFMIAINELLLGFETYSAHIISGTIVPREWVPILFAPISGIFLLLAGILFSRKRQTASIIAGVVLLLSLVVGLLGTFYHINRAFLFTAPSGEQISVPLLVWAPPVLAPLTFCLLSLLGISALWPEEPADSGILHLPRTKTFTLPFSKTRAYFFIAGLAIMATIISSVLDHSRTNFTNAWLWVPTAVGVFSCIIAIAIGFINKPNRADIITYTSAMLLMILTGLIGVVLHIQDDLTSQGIFVLERFVRGAPPLAPMLFADMGAIGLIALLNPADDNTHKTTPSQAE